jgi:hypothetical protein
MLSDNLKNLIKQNGKFQITVNFSQDTWYLDIQNQDEQTIGSIWEDSFEDNSITDLIDDLIPGEYLFEDEGYYDLQNEGKTQKFHRPKPNAPIVLWEIEIFRDFVEIKEMRFEKDIDFLSVVFNKFSNLQLGKGLLLDSKIEDPLKLFSDSLTSINYKVTEVSQIDSDENGYVYYNFGILTRNGNLIDYTYPQPDPISINEPSSFNEFIKYANSFGSELSDLTLAIKNNNLEQYLEFNSTISE